MVDRDVLDKMKGKGKEKKKKKKDKSKKKKSSKSGDGGSTEPFRLSEGARTSPEDVDINEESKNIRTDAQLNYDQGTGSLKEYKRRQVEEVKELHQDLYKQAKKYGSQLDHFTLVFHAAMMSFAQNRVGIATTVQEEFGKSKDESIKIADQICREAGEGRAFEKIASMLTEKFID